MANLKQTAAQIERRTKSKLARGTVDLELPIYDGQYAGRFGVVGEQVQDEMMEAVNTPGADRARALEATATFIAQSCRTLLGRGTKGGKMETLEHEDGRPVRFDLEFAEALELDAADGFPLDRMEAVVLACWVNDEGVLNDMALGKFVEALARWMTDTRREIEGEVVGG